MTKKNGISIQRLWKSCLPIFALGLAFIARAENPIVQTIYTADPAPLVYGDTLYLYTGHDEDDSKYFTMNNWHVFSSKDMVNWTDLGSPLSISSFQWAKGDAWAGQVIERNGRFYWYVPVNQKSGGMAIGVAVANSPVGPFKDALGKPLVFDRFGDIDPTVFIDKDGQAYLAWGNPVYKYVKLNEDMISFDTSGGDKGIYRSAMTIKEFGERSDDKRPSSYEEGPWLYQRNRIYYNIFAAGPIPEHLAYSTASSPRGPWNYRGVVMTTQQGSAFTNHPGVVDYRGRTYLFYHDARLPGGGGFDRSVSVEELRFQSDGSIPLMVMTDKGPDPIATLDPYRRNEAETIARETGVKVVSSDQGSMIVKPLRAGAFIKVRNIDFGSRPPSRFLASISQELDVDTIIELHLDKEDGDLLGSIHTSQTGNAWKTIAGDTKKIVGIHDLFFVFRGKGNLSGALLFDWWKFEH